MTIAEYRRAIEIYGTLGKPAATAGLLKGLAWALRMSGDYVYAKEAFDRVADLSAKNGVMTQDRAAAVLNGFLCLVDAGRIAEATKEFESLRHEIRSANRNHESLIERDALAKLVQALTQAHRLKEAEPFQKELVRLEKSLV